MAKRNPSNGDESKAAAPLPDFKEDILPRANALVKAQQGRVDTQERARDLYFFKWPELNELKWIKETFDPSSHNTVNWLCDVLNINEPQFQITIPDDAMATQQDNGAGTSDTATEMTMPGAMMGNGNGNGNLGGMGMGMSPDMGMMAGMPQGMPPDMSGMPPLPMETPELPAESGIASAKEMAQTLENVIKSAIYHNDQASETSLRSEMIKSAVLFGMVSVKMSDLRLSGQWAKRKKRFAGKPPFRFKCLAPTTVFYEYDEYGLSAVLQRYRRAAREVLANYKDENPNLKAWLDKNADKLNNDVVFCEWWTNDETVKWVERVVPLDEDKTDDAETDELSNEFVVEKVQRNAYEFIPYAIRIARGSAMFENGEYRVTPLLYALDKSKLGYRANLFLTIVSTLAFGMANKKWLFTSQTGDKAPDLDFNAGPELIPVKTGEEAKPLDVGLSNDLYQVLNVILQKVDESTVSKTIVGQVPQGVTAASALNLLTQGARLPLFPIQTAVGECLAQLALMVPEYLRAYARNRADEPLELYLTSKRQTITAAQLPNYIECTVTLKPDLPQDRAIIAQIIRQLRPGADQLISADTARNMINIEDPAAEEEKLDAEKAEQVVEDLTLQAEGQQLQQALSPQPQQPPPLPQGAPRPAGMPPPPPGMGDQAAAQAMLNGAQPPPAPGM